jgi:hypothetical protein
MALTINWKRADEFCSDAACVEVRKVGPWIQVRARQGDKTSNAISFTFEEWDAFIKGMKAGEFDL